MTHRWLLLLTAALFTTLISACGSRLPFDVSLAPTAQHDAVPTGGFTLVAFTRHVSDVGADVHLRGDVRQPFFTVNGQIIDIAGEPVQVYEYRAAEEAEAAAASVAPDGSAVRLGEAMTLIDWVATPHFYQRDRLVVVYVGEDDAVLNVLDGTLGRPFAGASAFRIAQ